MSALSPGQRAVLAQYPDAEWITPTQTPRASAVPVHAGPSLEAIIAKYGRGQPLPQPAAEETADDTEVVIALVRGRRRTFVVQGETIIAENG